MSSTSRASIAARLRPSAIANTALASTHRWLRSLGRPRRASLGLCGSFVQLHNASARLQEASAEAHNASARLHTVSAEPHNASARLHNVSAEPHNASAQTQEASAACKQQ